MTATAAITPSQLREDLFFCLLSGDRRGALRHAVSAIDDGLSLSRFVLDVLAPIQVQVGTLWERGEIHHQQEKLATEIAEILLTVAAGRWTAPPSGLKLVVCVADNEHHNLPAGMLAELLRAEGHAVTFLGTPRPHDGLKRLMRLVEPDAVVISCSLAMNLPGVLGLAQIAHSADLPVVTGGSGFNGLPARAAAVGADGYARSISEVADLTDRLRRSRTKIGGPATARRDEWSQLTRSRRQLASESAEQLMSQRGPVVPRALRSPKQLAARFGDLQRFLEAAVLVDDHILLEYMRWLVDRDAVSLRTGTDFAFAMLTTLRDRLDATLPIAASAADAAARGLA